MKIIRKLSFLALVAVAVAGVSMSAHATAITVDQIIYKINPPDPAGLNALQASNLSATVDMTFDSISGLLTITLTNTSGPTTITKNASNLLTGLGFNLPGGVTIIDTPPSQNSTITLPAGSHVHQVSGSTDTINDSLFSPDRWGYDLPDALGLMKDHFKVPGVLGVNFVLSTNQSDADKTFSGATANSTLMDQTDYGLISSGGSLAQQNYIKPSIQFSIYLSGVTVPTGLIAFINSGNVVVAYGSPTPTGFIEAAKVPEPLTLILYGFGFAGAGLYRHLRRRRSVSGLHS